MKSEIYPHRLKIGTATVSAEIPGGNSSVFKGHLPDGTTLYFDFVDILLQEIY